MRLLMLAVTILTVILLAMVLSMIADYMIINIKGLDSNFIRTSVLMVFLGTFFVLGLACIFYARTVITRGEV